MTHKEVNDFVYNNMEIKKGESRNEIERLFNRIYDETGLWILNDDENSKRYGFINYGFILGTKAPLPMLSLFNVTTKSGFEFWFYKNGEESYFKVIDEETPEKSIQAVIDFINEEH
jgi:hypothetical protein